MKFQQGEEVFSADNHSIGRIERVVLDPDTKEVTHLIIRKGIVLTKDRVVPLYLVAEDTENSVKLMVNATEANRLPEFEEQAYVPIPDGDTSIPPSGNFHWSPLSAYPVPPPAGSSPPGYIMETHRNVPEEMVALKTGAQVLSSDGEHVGTVEQVFTDARSDQVIYFVVSRGLFLKERKLVPITWVQIVADEEIHLNAPAERVATLPDYEAAGHRA
jgi:sporulation protein YlmC with PRC-barrel domain